MLWLPRRKKQQPPRALVALAVLASACPLSPGEEPSTPSDQRPSEGTVELGAAIVCEDPVEGIARFEDEAEARGLWAAPSAGSPDAELPPYFLFSSSIVAQDIDDDGDIDLVAAGGPPRPALFLNDGLGSFEKAPDPEPPGLEGFTRTGAVADLSGDRLPELLVVWHRPGTDSGGELVVWPNEGGGAFGTPQVYSLGLTGPAVEPTSISLGDVDGDGDLDVAWATLGPQVDDSAEAPGDWLFINEGGTFEEHIELVPYAPETGGVRALVTTFTDRDGDGDQDLWFLGGREKEEQTLGVDYGDRGSAFWRNDGPATDGRPSLVNDGAETASDINFPAMGLDSYDLNADGQLDYCVTDVGRPLCLLSDASGLYYEGGAALGLEPAQPSTVPVATIGWSLDFRDLDNDGWTEVLHASAPDHGGVWQGVEDFPGFQDLLWRGLPDGRFEDVTAEVGFGDVAQHIGMSVADFDGDGWLDVVFPVADPRMDTADRPKLLMNQCGAAAWLEVDLLGPAANTEGFGARLEADLGDRVIVRELYNLRGTGQNPSNFHLGLGGLDTLPQLEVLWPDGVLTRAVDVPTRRRIRVVHPDAELSPSE